MNKPKVVVLTGAGISAESGINTFRDADGLWEGHDVMEVASPEGWARNQDLVLDFYNQRRRQLKTVAPNKGHYALTDLEDHCEVVIVTQNVDDLHERAGSHRVIHLHGELRKVRSTRHPDLVYDWPDDCVTGDTCERGEQLRPHIVWFGEMVPEIERAALEIQSADYVLIIGTSMQVYPAAGLFEYAPSTATIYYIDPKPALIVTDRAIRVVAEPATTGVRRVVNEILGEVRD